MKEFWHLRTPSFCEVQRGARTWRARLMLGGARSTLALATGGDDGTGGGGDIDGEERGASDSGDDGDPALSRVEAFLMMVKLVASLQQFGGSNNLWLMDLPNSIVTEDGAFLEEGDFVENFQRLRETQYSSVRDTGIFCGVDLSVWPQGALWPADFDA